MSSIQNIKFAYHWSVSYFYDNLFPRPYWRPPKHLKNKLLFHHISEEISTKMVWLVLACCYAVAMFWVVAYSKSPHYDTLVSKYGFIFSSRTSNTWFKVSFKSILQTVQDELHKDFTPNVLTSLNISLYTRKLTLNQQASPKFLPVDTLMSHQT